MPIIFKIFLGLLGLVPLALSRENSDCYTLDYNPYLHFGTKTAYDLIYERLHHRNNEEIQECQPVQLWVMARHGTRFPSRATIRAMQQLESTRNSIITNHEERRNGRLCYADIEKLKEWTLNVSLTDAKFLSPQGKADMYYLAKRFRSRFPTLFTQGYSQDHFVFRHTHTERTRQSALAFAEGMFGSSTSIWIPQPLENDTVIKPYENCTAWKTAVAHNETYNREILLFEAGLEMANLVHNVSQRLGFTYDLSVDSMKLMYDMCRYDKAWNFSNRSPWCAAFSKEELLVMEYLEDLKSFYEAGYGSELNMRLGCTPLKDLLERFSQLMEDSVDSDFQPLGIFHFTHSDMISMTLSRMLIADGSLPLTHDNFYEQKNRKWRSSKLTPFAANIAAVFLKCSHGDPNRVMFYHNEKLLHMDGCDVGLCTWDWVKERFYNIPLHCDLEWCNAATNVHVTSFLAVLLLLPILRLWQ